MDRQTKNFGWRFVVALASLLICLFINVTEIPSQTATSNAGEGSPHRRRTVNYLKLERSLFYEKPALGAITAIRWNWSNVDTQPVLVIAGNYGASLVDHAGKALSSVRLERKAGKTTPVDMDGDGKLEYIDRKSPVGEAALYDHQGQLVWKYGLGYDPEVEDMACGDLDGDGQWECVVALKGYGGLRLLEKSGKEKWRQPDTEVRHVEILDADGDGANEIVHSNVAGQVRLRNAKGVLIRELPAKNYVTLFSVCRWPTGKDNWFILSNKSRSEIELLDFEGKKVGVFSTGVRGYEAFGTPVTFAAGEKSYFALLICNCASTRNTRLFIYNSNGELVYEDKLPTRQASLLAIPDETAGGEALLIGENEGRVWRYRAPSPGQSGRN